MKKRMHFFFLDRRIKHNIRKVKKELFFDNLSHFMKNRKQFKMTYWIVLKRAIESRQMIKLGLENKCIVDAARGIRY